MFFNLSCGFPPKSLYDKKGVWIILMLLWIVQAMIVSQARVNKYLQWWDKIALPSCPKDAQNMINTNCVRDLTARIKLGRKMRKSDVFRCECNFMTLSTGSQVREVLWDSRWTVRWPQTVNSRMLLAPGGRFYKLHRKLRRTEKGVTNAVYATN